MEENFDYEYEHPRAIKKHELAKMYGCSRKTLMKRINRFDHLVSQLEKTGCDKFTKIFTPKEMEMICEVIGYPYKKRKI
ncbi:DUF4248 domain-containing protein [Paludibacteraceae bacterium OttesenSCG-928-F17]|nr:DUF4248 domain-containing protein [Paludibacteraceae bacterium OttesenSCG-928-F17]